jgi:hypothetical protein
LTNDFNHITIYNVGENGADKNYVVTHPRLIVHELGHAYDIAIGNVENGITGDLMRGDPTRHTDDFGRWYGFAGGWEDWQFGYANNPSEVFADMFIG